MSKQPNISQNNEQILNDIQSLQQMEQQLFNNLETNTNLNPEEQQKIVEKMNQISNMRVNLYQTLSSVNNFFENALTSSIGTLQEQTVAIGIVESELNKAKKRLEALQEDKNNKIRLVEINNYFGEKYAEHSQLMKIIIFTLVPVIILAILNNKNILPNLLFYILVVIVSIIGSIYFWYYFASIIMRDNMNYQEYNWYFNPNTAPTGSHSVTDPWLSLNVPGTCVGQYCCSDGQSYDSSLNQCVGVSNVTLSNVSESFINNILSKKQYGKFKSDYNMGYLKPLNS
jgi:membrane-associated HD superfamily phosphohydrolase